MLKLLRKRRAAITTTDAVAEALQIRNLLDDPQLRAVMGDPATAATVPPIRLDWNRGGQVHRPNFGRRLLQRAA